MARQLLQVDRKKDRLTDRLTDRDRDRETHQRHDDLVLLLVDLGDARDDKLGHRQRHQGEHSEVLYLKQPLQHTPRLSHTHTHTPSQ
eukprot:303663-Prorocentrum_minimum.AAC.1